MVMSFMSIDWRRYKKYARIPYTMNVLITFITFWYLFCGKYLILQICFKQSESYSCFIK
jgi:hypothetical protein